MGQTSYLQLQGHEHERRHEQLPITEALSAQRTTCARSSQTELDARWAWKGAPAQGLLGKPPTGRGRQVQGRRQEICCGGALYQAWHWVFCLPADQHSSRD